ncbi:LOW QUALITY PROTEIN: ectonucleotide pyrophosphatase/phosphodiesterase family member 7-like [Aplochiton taeniatus]
MKALLVLVLAALLSGSADSRPYRGATQRNKLLVVSFDGFRWDYDQDVDTPNLDQLVLDGVKAKYITPPMITMTSPSHFTTITGRWIEDHGVVHNMMYNATTNLKLPHKLTMKKSEWWDNGVLPLWITAQNQGLKTGSFHYPGGGVNYSGQAVNRALVENHGDPDANETLWKQNVHTVLHWLAQEDFDFVTLYYGEPDNVGHAVGPETEARKKIIQQIDRLVGYLRDAMETFQLTQSLNVILTSDHGMTTIKKRPVVDEIVLQEYLNLLQLTSFELLDYGGFGIMTPRKGKEQEVFEALSKAPNLTVYRKEDIPDSFHISRNKRIQPIMVVADLGFNLNSRFPVYVNKGDHGFHNGEMDMKTIFRAFGPDFKANYMSEPFDSVHIYPLMCELLHIQPAPNNGSITFTQGMLKTNGGSRTTGLMSPRLLVSLAFCVLKVL